MGSIASGEESGIGPASDDSVFLRPRTPPRREDRQLVRTGGDGGDQSEESDADTASATTTSSFDDLSKDIEDKVRNN
jgi:hypothetical protein